MFFEVRSEVRGEITPAAVEDCIIHNILDGRSIFQSSIFNYSSFLLSERLFLVPAKLEVQHRP